ncbi:MAG: hypothetical protein ACLR56_14995 [Oscillospiraceae bacterium]
MFRIYSGLSRQNDENRRRELTEECGGNEKNGGLCYAAEKAERNPMISRS